MKQESEKPANLWSVFGQRVRTLWFAINDLYFVFFFIWFGLSMTTHGRFAWVNLANMFAFAVFLSVIPAAVTGIIYRSRRLQIASAIAALLFLFVFGKFFIPKAQNVAASSKSLKVMTYNMLSFSPEPSAVVDVIREEDADIVFLQETNFGTAELLETEMKDVYPYQIHYPSNIPIGTSIISKHPFTQINETLKSTWVGKPILLKVKWNGREINVVNFHMVPTPLPTVVFPSIFNNISNTRKVEAGLLINFLKTHPEPTIIAGDMNDVFLNDAYIMLTDVGLRDVWMESGVGLGHTFPGNKSPGTSRIQIGGYYVPEWLVRIDYIFVTPEWGVVTTHIARTDGYSDHRPVVAVLHLK
jgi:endonuclease/exonuclease/phosphatase (EEP) superfamily protein YafD